MKAFVHYKGELYAGIRSTYFEFDLDDMFDGLFDDDPELREIVRDQIKDLAALGHDVPDRVTFSDECEWCHSLVKDEVCSNNKCTSHLEE